MCKFGEVLVTYFSIYRKEKLGLQTDRRIDGQTDGKGDNNIPPAAVAEE